MTYSEFRDHFYLALSRIMLAKSVPQALPGAAPFFPFREILLLRKIILYYFCDYSIIYLNQFGRKVKFTQPGITLIKIVPAGDLIRVIRSIKNSCFGQV